VFWTALLALMAQLGAGASVARLDPLTQIVGAELPCHASNGVGDTPAPTPLHPLDCMACPLCVALHSSPAALAPNVAILTPTATVVVLRSELPPQSTAPPSRPRAPHQPRAPPAVS
jgi:hypothetical protein